MQRTFASAPLLRSLGLALLAAASVMTACGEDSATGGDAGAGGSADSGGSGSGGARAGSGDDGLGGAPVIEPDDPIEPGANNPADPECNFSGAWLVRTTTTSVALDDDQVARRWYYYEVAQDGERFQISESLNCQVRVETAPCTGIGCTVVTMSDDATAAVLERTSHAGTQGTFAMEGGECAFTMTPVYEVRGVTPDAYLPEDPADDLALSELTPLPTAGDDADVTDWDGDGQPGLRFDIDAVLDGSRNSGQRDKQTFYSVAGDADYAVPLEATQFVLKADIELEENVYAAPNPIFETLGELAADGHYVELFRLGDDRADAGLPADDFAACQALEAEYPYDCTTFGACN